MTIRQNPDRDYAKEVRDKLKSNGGYCPCRLEKQQTPNVYARNFKSRLKEMSPVIAIADSIVLKRTEYVLGLHRLMTSILTQSARNINYINKKGLYI